MTLKDLIMQTSFDDISQEARKVYHVNGCSYTPSTDNALRNIFDRLKGIDPVTNEMIISATDYNVYGYYDEKTGEMNPEEYAGYCYSLTTCPWEKWLGMRICDESLKELSPEAIIANCLYEMSWWGYDEESIQTNIEDA